MSKGSSNAPFLTTPSSSSGEDEIHSFFEIPNLLLKLASLFDLHYEFPKFDLTIIGEYWLKIVTLMKTLVFLAIIVLAWIYILRPRWRKRRLNSNRWN
jgi:hypothetical protein